MSGGTILKLILVIPFLIAGGLAVAMLSYIMVPMMVAGAIFSLLYISAIDLQQAT